MREVEILWAGKWIEVDFSSIKKGDVFRMFDNCTPVRDKGTTVFVATEDASYCQEWETYMVTYDPYYGTNEP